MWCLFEDSSDVFGDVSSNQAAEMTGIIILPAAPSSWGVFRSRTNSYKYSWWRYINADPVLMSLDSRVELPRTQVRTLYWERPLLSWNVLSSRGWTGIDLSCSTTLRTSFTCLAPVLVRLNDSKLFCPTLSVHATILSPHTDSQLLHMKKNNYWLLRNRSSSSTCRDVLCCHTFAFS